MPSPPGPCNGKIDVTSPPSIAKTPYKYERSDSTLKTVARARSFSTQFSQVSTKELNMIPDPVGSESIKCLFIRFIKLSDFSSVFFVMSNERL